jgi:2-polyprenyl-3-methyl-5-hydroxy-6-metoxy-1,4-benzoquinol methylase
MAELTESTVTARDGAGSQADRIRDYWEAYADRVLERGGELDPREHFSRLRADHEIAYARANQLLQRHELAGKAVLELGCGMGFDTIPLAQAGARVVAIDLSEKCLGLTRRHLAWFGAKADLRRGNAERLDFADESFDVVIARGLLMFTPGPAAVLGEALRVLRPGGVVQAILHNRYSWYVLLGVVAGMNLVDPVEDPAPNRLYTRGEARALLEEFADVRIDGGRLPNIRSKRGGLAAKLFNASLVPVTKALPRRLLEPFSFYLIVEGTRPVGR